MTNQDHPQQKLTASDKETEVADATNKIRTQREVWLAKIRLDWYRIMRPFGRWVPEEVSQQVMLEEKDFDDYYFQPAGTLQWKHLRNCKVVSNRFELVNTFMLKNGIVAEVGTLVGDFAKFILQTASPKKLHIIDRTLRNFPRGEFEPSIENGTVELHESDSAEALSGFPDAYFDWIYIDADHSYDGVRRDIQSSKHKLKPDGMLVFNDYIFWSHQELCAYGVVQAVNELCINEDWEILYLALQPEMYNDVVLRKLQVQAK